MPELVDVARHYDDIKFYDGYTGDYLFRGQFSSFAEASPEGSTARKRVLSVSPSVVMPSRRAVSFLGETWLVALGLVDGFDGKAIRRTHWMKLVTDTCQLLTPKQACLGLAGTSVKVFREEYKYTVNSATDSEYDPFWSLSLATVEGAQTGSFFKIGDLLLRARMVVRAKEDLDQALCDQLDTGYSTIGTFYTGTYNPITDAVATGSVLASVVIFDSYQLYSYATAADEKMHTGDKALIVPQTSLTPVAGSRVAIDGRDWTILSVKPEQDCWALHVRLT